MLDWLFYALLIGLALIAVVGFTIWKIKFDWTMNDMLLRPGYDPDANKAKPLDLSNNEDEDGPLK